jgi:taurine dioxygenase
MVEALSVTPLTTSIGARIEGIDLHDEIATDVAEQIRQELNRHFVLVFPGQHITLKEQSRLAEVFGPLEPLPSLKFLGAKDASVKIDEKLVSYMERSLDWRSVEHPAWHTDSSFTAQIPRAAVLRAEVISPVGGGTSWINMCAAYDALSPLMQQWLTTLKAVHWFQPDYKQALGFDQFSPELQAEFDRQFHPREHPVVIQHPESGRLALFVNPQYTLSISGLKAKESRNLLHFLFRHAGSQQFVYRHRWTPGDIVVWDELVTLHLVPDDYAPHPRRVVRVTAGLVEPRAPA